MTPALCSDEAMPDLGLVARGRTRLRRIIVQGAWKASRRRDAGEPAALARGTGGLGIRTPTVWDPNVVVANGMQGLVAAWERVRCARWGRE